MDGLNSDFEIGSKIRLYTLDDDIFEGILQYWDKSNEKGKLVLNNVYLVNENSNSKSACNSTANYLNYEIKKVEYACKDRNNNDPLPEPIQKKSNNGCSSTRPKNSIHLSTNSSNDDNKQIKQALKKQAPNSKELEYMNHIDQSSIKKREKVIDLSSFSHAVISDYSSAVSIIKSVFLNMNCSTIALKIFTNEWMRHGKISLISLCLEKEDYWTYIFDMDTIAQEDEGDEMKLAKLLNTFLSNPKITKVIQHKVIGDMLYYRYNIVLDSFYEINAACKQMYPEITPQMLNFENILCEFLPNAEKNELDSDDLSIDWDRRPLNKAQKYYIIRQTVMSLKVYDAIKERMERIFQNNCVNDYKSLLECDDENAVRAIYDEVETNDVFNSRLCSQPFHSSTITLNAKTNDDVFDGNETMQTISSSASSSISKIRAFLQQGDKYTHDNDTITKTTSYNENMFKCAQPKNQTLYDKNYIYLPAGMNRSYTRNSRHSISNFKENLFYNE